MLLALLVLATAADTAFLVVHKKATLQKVKGGERVNVAITLHNAGSATAYDVSLTDDTWPSALFSLVSGNTSRTWEKLEVGGSQSHSFTVEARSKGPFSGSPAVVKYRVASKSALQEAFSTPLPLLDILSDKPAEKKYDWVSIQCKILNEILVSRCSTIVVQKLALHGGYLCPLILSTKFFIY
jgi:translocon-associated protein subunit beta